MLVAPHDRAMGATVLSAEIRAMNGDPSQLRKLGPLGRDVEFVSTRRLGSHKPSARHLCALERIIDEAPYLISARTHQDLIPHEAAHVRLAAVWERRRLQFRNCAMALSNALSFFLPWSFPLSHRIAKRLGSEGGDFWYAARLLGEYNFVGSDLGWPGCTRATALRHFEKAVQLLPSGGHEFVGFHGHIAMLALETNAVRRSQSTAEWILANCGPGENTHMALSVLGRLSLRRRKTTEAIDYLESSAQTIWSERGPSLRLARELLATDEGRRAVARFLKALGNWPGRAVRQRVRTLRAAMKQRRYGELVSVGI